MSTVEEQKRVAAERALDFVESGMVLGLGSGSTAYYAIVGLGRRLAAGELRDVRGVPTSSRTERLARDVGVPLIDLPASGCDLAIDGMDEVTADLDAIKGMGGALTREKIVAASARRFVLIGDESKRVDRLGERTPVPVEVIAFGRERTRARLEAFGCRADLRLTGQGGLFATDNGNPVFDCRFDAPFDPARIALELAVLPGVIDHGLFLGLADVAFVASTGGVEAITGEDARRARTDAGA